MFKTLTIYYSRRGNNYYGNTIKYLEKGNCEIAAGFIHEAVGGDIFEIDTVEPYDEDYHKCCAQAKVEADNNVRPAIKATLPSLDDYDLIFVVFPCWYATCPMCVFTFLDQFDLTGKRLAPLCSNEGSGMGKSERDLQKLYPTAKILPGLPVRGCKTVESKTTIVNWAKKNL
ncbi:MAG: flavodoxin [Planctomycetia bacterium]|nr:flavodoxin [Planctomycetia bacterium]